MEDRKNILEIGGGHAPFPFDEDANSVVRVDWNPVGADVVHDLNRFPYPFTDDEFDVVFASHCIEHLVDKTRAFKAIHRILKPKGIAIIRVPHISSPNAFNYDHVSFWHLGSMNGFVNADWYGGGTFPKFELLSARFCWRIRDPVRPYRDSAERFCSKAALEKGVKMYGLLDRLINGFLASHRWFGERYLYYWIGGIDEIEFMMRPG